MVRFGGKMNMQPNKITEELKMALSIPNFKELNCPKCKNGIILDVKFDANAAINYTIDYIEQHEDYLRQTAGRTYASCGEELANKDGKTFYTVVSSPCPYKYCMVTSEAK